MATHPFLKFAGGAAALYFIIEAYNRFKNMGAVATTERTDTTNVGGKEIPNLSNQESNPTFNIAVPGMDYGQRTREATFEGASYWGGPTMYAGGSSTFSERGVAINPNTGHVRPGSSTVSQDASIFAPVPAAPSKSPPPGRGAIEAPIRAVQPALMPKYWSLEPDVKAGVKKEVM